MEVCIFIISYYVVFYFPLAEDLVEPELLVISTQAQILWRFSLFKCVYITGRSYSLNSWLKYCIAQKFQMVHFQAFQ